MEGKAHWAEVSCSHSAEERFQDEGQPCVRCTPELDFLRGEPGSVLPSQPRVLLVKLFHRNACWIMILEAR